MLLYKYIVKVVFPFPVVRYTNNNTRVYTPINHNARSRASTAQTLNSYFISLGF